MQDLSLTILVLLLLIYHLFKDNDVNNIFHDKLLNYEYIAVISKYHDLSAGETE